MTAPTEASSAPGGLGATPIAWGGRGKANAGYIPFAALCVGAGLGGWIASLIGIPAWALAVPGLVGGYYLARTILRDTHVTYGW